MYSITRYFPLLLTAASPTPPQTVARDRIAKGLVLFVIAALVVTAGLIGYIKYDELVEPNMPVFVCCVPSAVIAFALIFFGIARRWALFRYSMPMPAQGISTQRISPDGRAPNTPKDDEAGRPEHHGAKKIRRREPAPAESEKTGPDKSELEQQRRNLLKVLEDLKEQHKDGLIVEDAYNSLKTKYTQELKQLEMLEKRNQR